MFDAVVKALSQMFTPPFRRVLLKSIALPLILIVLLSIGLCPLFSWGAVIATTWAEGNVGAVPHGAWTVLLWVLSFLAGLGIITGGIFLMPAVTAFVGSFFVDEIADVVEQTHYPKEMPGMALPF